MHQELAKNPDFSRDPHDLPHPSMLFFPWLDSRTEPSFLAEDVFFLDPGIRRTASPNIWRPPDLPLSEAMAMVFLRESSLFARERGRGGSSLTAVALAGYDFYAKTALSIQSELTGGSKRQPIADQALRCQQILLLAWQLEQQALELRELQGEIATAWESLDRELGVEETDDHPDFLKERQFLGSQVQDRDLSWPIILEALLFFLPPKTALVSTLRDVHDAMEDIASCTAEEMSEHLPEQANTLAFDVRTICAPGWRLVGKEQCPADKPWLEPRRLVLLGHAPADAAGDEPS